MVVATVDTAACGTTQRVGSEWRAREGVKEAGGYYYVLVQERA
jgi:hypothetical protein